MNLAYDPYSVEPLWEEAVDRWGEPAVGLQGLTRVQEVLYWDEAGDIVTPPMPSSPRSDGGTSSLEASDVGDDETDAAAVGGEVNLGASAPVTPDWPRQRGRASSSSSQRWGSMAANPHVCRGRWKQAWKVKSKLQWRAQSQRCRQRAARERLPKGPG